MKLLFYSPVDLLAGGGCERWHCDITNSLKKQFGYDIEILTGGLGQKRWDQKYLTSQLEGIPHVRVGYVNFLGVLIPTVTTLKTLYKHIKQADAVHFIYGFMGQDIIMLLMKLLTGTKIVVGHHAPIYHHSRIHNLYMKYVSRFVLNFFDYHQTLNAKDKKYFESQWNIKNVYFIPSGVRVEKFLKLKKKKHDGLVFVSVGRYALQKGLDLGLEAIEQFNSENPGNKASFYFVGSGELGGTIKEYSKRNKNIKDWGYLSYDQVQNVYSQSDIYFLPSREEPFGLVLIESWATGMPVLATKTEGPLDMLEENKNGWFIPQINSESIKNSLTKVYKQWQKNNHLLTSFVSSCKTTGERYSIDTTASRMHQNFFQKI